MTINKTGTYRIKFSIYWTGNSTTVYGRIYKNGVAYGIERSNASSTPVEFTEDLSFNVGDKLQLFLKTNDYQGVTKNFRVCAMITNILPVVNIN
jgi:hypothetical protein